MLPFLDQEALLMVTQVLVTSCLDDCNALSIRLPLKTIQKVQLVQNAAIHKMIVSPRLGHATLWWHELLCLLVSFQVQLKMLAVTFKAFYGTEQGYLD